MIAARFLWVFFIISVVVLFSPLFVGRSFCGWVCPLGTVIDASDHLIAPAKDSVKRRYSSWKFKILVVIIFAALLGVNLGWWIDPLSTLWRSFGAVFIPLLTVITHGIFNGLLEYRIAEDLVYELYDSITRSLVPIKTMSVNTAVITGVLFSSILLLSRISKRFWCRVICPLGALLGLISKFSPLQRVVIDESCSNCALCRRDCKMGAINGDFKTTEKSECIFCLNCAQVCEQKGTKFTFKKMNRMISPVDVSKREFLGYAGVGILTASLLKVNHKEKQNHSNCIRPPGSVNEQAFLDRCIRCNECIRICASTGACLQPSVFESGLEGFFTPFADFRKGYCEYTCNLCGEICPTGAISELPLEEKKQYRMGLAIFDKDVCIPYRKNENCIVCEEHCPTPEKAIIFDKKLVLDEKQGVQRDVLYPKVDEEKCIGCGICQEKCPVTGNPGVYVTRINALDAG